MSSPPIQVFLTTIASQPALRQRQEYVLRILQIKKIPFTSYDLASNEDAKRLWKRKAPVSKQQLPGILVGGTFPGNYDDFEEAVEYDELDRFLQLKESWNPDPEDGPALAAKPIGVPGASSPVQMTNHNPSFATPTPSPLKDKSKDKGLDAGLVLGDAGLQGVSVTDADLEALLSELGLEGDDAGELVKGLSTAKESRHEEKEVNVTEKGVMSDSAGSNISKVNESLATGEEASEVTGEKAPEVILEMIHESPIPESVMTDKGKEEEEERKLKE
ncbi:hypothetical protein EW145_g805 [Phellinidium pouzarii]|uniref:Uncharacterized protein n=1 Tax=Phellinidium pouzarii TaxID=167371 RepID=A0A4S4LIP5_9AGAM|nr:hypothetical protein EW145_g805 [Phellinidium pouzarii]